MLGRRSLALAAASLFVATTHVASAQQTKLVFATTNPPVVPLTRQVLHPWADRINQQGQEAVSINVVDGHTIANPANYFDRISNDVMQIAWGLQGILGAKYQLSLLTTGDALNESTELRSLAFWRLYRTGLLDGEYADTVPLGLIAFPASAVHLRRAVRSTDDLSGLKLIVSDLLASNMVGRLNGTSISLPLQESYSALQRGVVDGVVIAWSAIAPFKLAEVTSYHIDSALSSGTGWVFMMRSKYQALPAAVRKVIDDNSGEAFSRQFGAFWDRQIAEGRALTEKADPKHTIARLSPEQDEKWRLAARLAADERAKAIPGGEQVLAAFRDIVRKVKSE